MASDRIVASVSSANGRLPRARLPVGVLTILLVALAIGVCRDVGAPSMAPPRRAWLEQGAGLIRAIFCTPGGGLLVATRGASGVSVWTVDRFGHGQQEFTVVDGSSVAFSPDGSVLAIGADSKVVLWDTGSETRRIEFPTQTGRTVALAFSRDSKMLAVAGDRSLTILDAATGHNVPGAVPKLRGVTTVAFSPSGHALATGDNEGHIRIWDLTTGQERAAARAHSFLVSCLHFSNDGAKLVSASFADPVPRIWDANTCRPLASLRGHSAPVQTAAFSWDGRTVASAAMNGDLRLWHVETGRQVAILHGLDADVLAIAFSPDGRILVAGGVGHTVWTWDVAR
jgi:WD40 repeat protein